MTIQWTRSKDIIWEELNGEALLIDTASESAWVLNATATHLWKHCEKFGVECLVEELARVGNRQLEQVREEVRTFLEAMQARCWFKSQPVAYVLAGVSGEMAFSANYTVPACRPSGLIGGVRKRPSPRGNSGPG